MSLEQEKSYKEKKKVVLNKSRNFGELLGAPFAFILQEFRYLVPMILKYSAPFLLVAILLMSLFANNMFFSLQSGLDRYMANNIIYVIFFGLLYAFAFFMAIIVINSYMVLYSKLGSRNFTSNDVWKKTKTNILPLLGAYMLVSISIGAIFSLLGFIAYEIGAVGLIFIAYIPLIYLMIPMMFIPIVIINEKVGAINTIKRVFEIIKGNWWATLGLIIVFSIIMSIFSYILIIPIYIIMMVMVFAGASGGATGGIGMVIGMIFIAVMYFLVYLVSISFQQVLIGFQYFNLVSTGEAPGLLDRINAINNMENNDVQNTDIESSIFKVVKDEDVVKDETVAKENIENAEKNDKIEDKKQDKSNRFLDDSENNRFSGNSEKPENDFSDKEEKDKKSEKDDYDRFKPKY